MQERKNVFYQLLLDRNAVWNLEFFKAVFHNRPAGSPVQAETRTRPRGRGRGMGVLAPEWERERGWSYPLKCCQVDNQPTHTHLG